jgi:hypothetical protein
MIVWASSSMVGRVRIAAACTPDESGAGAAVSLYWVNGVNLCWYARMGQFVAVERGGQRNKSGAGARGQAVPKPACPVTRLHQRVSSDGVPLLDVFLAQESSRRCRCRVARRRAVPCRPWGEGATTLEWNLLSPPPFHSWQQPPVVAHDRQDTPRERVILT